MRNIAGCSCATTLRRGCKAWGVRQRLLEKQSIKKDCLGRKNDKFMKRKPLESVTNIKKNRETDKEKKTEDKIVTKKQRNYL